LLLILLPANKLQRGALGLLPLPASEAQRGEGWGEGLFAVAPLTQFASWQHHCALSPLRGARARAAPGVDNILSLKF